MRIFISKYDQRNFNNDKSYILKQIRNVLTFHFEIEIKQPVLSMTINMKKTEAIKNIMKLNSRKIFLRFSQIFG
jgi:hypothetical protein